MNVSSGWNGASKLFGSFCRAISDALAASAAHSRLEKSVNTGSEAAAAPKKARRCGNPNPFDIMGTSDRKLVGKGRLGVPVASYFRPRRESALCCRWRREAASHRFRPGPYKTRY